MRGFTMRAGVLAIAGGLTLSLAAPVALAAAPAQAATVTKASTPNKVLFKYGSKGKAVYRLEKRIKVVPANTVYKSDTMRRVKQVQRWAKLPQTGKVDQRTMTAINRWVKAQKAIAAKKAKASAKARAKIIKAAKKYDGGRYKRGGSSPRGFDCSGYVKYVVKKATGKKLARTASSQRKQIKKISRSSAKPGDLVFFHKGSRVYHVGVYAGGKKLYHASRPGTKTGIGPIFSSKVTFGRVV
jgi:cell wall-associated NlpC family hydrolase